MKCLFYANRDLYYGSKNRAVSDSHVSCSGLSLMRALERCGHEVQLFYDEDVTEKISGGWSCQTRRFKSTAPTDDDGNLKFDLAGVVDMDSFSFAVMKRDSVQKHVLEFLGETFEKRGRFVVNSTNCPITHRKDYCRKPEIEKYMPSTFYEAEPRRITGLIEQMGDVILKPIDLGGGRGITRIRWGDADISEVISRLTSGSTKTIVIQEYLPSVADGTKRILVLANPEASYVDAFTINLCTPNADGICNFGMGGELQPEIVTTDDERQMMEDIAPVLVSDGVYFAGVDVIGGKLIEINTVNPGFGMNDDINHALSFDKRVSRFFEVITSRVPLREPARGCLTSRKPRKSGWR